MVIPQTDVDLQHWCGEIQIDAIVDTGEYGGTESNVKIPNCHQSPAFQLEHLFVIGLFVIACLFAKCVVCLIV